MALELMREIAEGVDAWGGADFVAGESQEAVQALVWACAMDEELREKFNRLVDETRAGYERERASLE